MAYPDDRETVYANSNVCKSFKLTLANTNLTSLTGQVCSEVLVVNKSGQDLSLFDNGDSQADHCMLVGDGESITIRGLTNSNQLSAKLASGTRSIYYRTQYFSNNPSR